MLDGFSDDLLCCLKLELRLNCSRKITADNEYTFNPYLFALHFFCLHAIDSTIIDSYLHIFWCMILARLLQLSDGPK